MATTEVLQASDASLERRTTISGPYRPARFTKRLSLNFPILPPTASATAPATASPHSSSTTTLWSPRPKRADTCPQSVLPSPSPTKTGNEILTLVAAQERRVLELREELAKAESELSSLKKKWAVHEANKKRDEVRYAQATVSPLADLISPRSLSGQDVVDMEEERRRRRALVERSKTRSGQQTQCDGRKASPRVFQGSHTRALSLLSHQSPPPKHSRTHTPAHSFAGFSPLSGASPPKFTTSPQSIRSVEEGATMASLDGFVSLVPRPQSFGQRYKDLAAAQQKALSPTSADALLKSGKQVVDGVRDGLWTFFEDIRQATVGDEAINGPSTPNSRRRRSSKLINTTSSSSSRTKERESTSSHDAQNRSAGVENSTFWAEFGLDPPRSSSGGGSGGGGGGGGSGGGGGVTRPAGNERNARRSSHHAHRQETRHRKKDNKSSSTSSQNVPDLLLNDTSDEEWEQWDYPVSNDKQHEVVAATATSEGEGEGDATSRHANLSDSAWPPELITKANEPKGLNIEHLI